MHPDFWEASNWEEKKEKGRKEKRKEKERFMLIIRQFILKGNSYRFQMIFEKRDECHFVVGVSCFVIYPIATSNNKAAIR